MSETLETPIESDESQVLKAGLKKLENMRNALYRSLAVVDSIRDDLNKIVEYRGKLMQNQKK
jgi:hypothetical protein